MKRIAGIVLLVIAALAVLTGLGLSGWRFAARAGISHATRVRCEALRGVRLVDGKVVDTKVSPAGFEPSWKTALIGVWGFNLPETCRVRVVLRPSPDSLIQSAIWLPTKTWNQRLQGIGNGGLAGSIDELQMTAVLQYGYAVAATDGGHEAQDMDGSWALGHPEKIKDYGWRSIHETAVVAKSIAAGFYGHPPRYSYFAGGSNGGRSALMEAERFPEDYDGIVAGAPSFDGINNITTVTWMQKLLNSSEASYIRQSKLPAIAAAVLKQCDALDGVRDGVLEDPRICNFDPAVLVCRAAVSDACLTPSQVTSLRAIYEGPGGAFGDSKHWGFEKGGEAGWGEWMLGSKRFGGLHYQSSLTFHRFLVYGDPKWDFSRFSFWSDRIATARRLGPDYAARDPDLTPFAARGGKLILYHGWSDPALQPHLTIDYFERVQARMGAEAAAGFIRLYMVPGLLHVVGGPGPNVFGQIPQGPGVDAHHSVTAAVEAWVEHGIAPGRIIASKYSSDLKPLLAPSSFKPIRTRPLCPYPAVARWKGSGSTDEAENFVCITAQ